MEEQMEINGQDWWQFMLQPREGLGNNLKLNDISQFCIDVGVQIDIDMEKIEGDIPNSQH